MKINKSSRHAKITGDFGETLVLYWLSKYGFECAPVDHTGIDIIARNPHNHEIMGISVKSRSRNECAQEEHISIPNDNRMRSLLRNCCRRRSDDPGIPPPDETIACPFSERENGLWMENDENIPEML